MGTKATTPSGLKHDLDLAVSLVDRLDLALEHDPTMAHGIASDLEATLDNARRFVATDPEALDMLRSIRSDVAMIRSMLATDDRPSRYMGTLSDLLDHAYMGTVNAHARLTGSRLTSCSIPSF